jgi:hypothetical protein
VDGLTWERFTASTAWLVAPDRDPLAAQSGGAQFAASVFSDLVREFTSESAGDQPYERMHMDFVLDALEQALHARQSEPVI